MSNLVQRLLTAAVLVPILIIELFVDKTPWSILAMAVLATAAAHDEFVRMALPRIAGDDGPRDDPAPGLRAVVLTLGAGLMIACTVFGKAMAPALTIIAMGLGAVILARKHALDRAAHTLVACFASILYIPLLATTWPLIKADLPNGAAWLFVTLGIAFFSDTVAYFFGRFFGRHKLYPAVSPKKTWEGSFGGLVGGVSIAVGFGSLWLIPEMPIGHAVALGVLGSACGQIGDLVESMIKRGFGVKDSGTLLPGHGGMLDRVDALLFVAPVVYFYVRLVLPLAGA